MDTPNKKSCSNCRWFMSPSDPHPVCPLCRTCTRENGCTLEVNWSEEDWGAFEAKKASLRIAREKAKANLKSAVPGGDSSPRGSTRESIPSVPTSTPTSSFQSALDKGGTGRVTPLVPPKKTSKRKTSPRGAPMATKKKRVWNPPRALGQA